MVAWNLAFRLADGEILGIGFRGCELFAGKDLQKFPKYGKKVDKGAIKYLQHNRSYSENVAETLLP